MADSKYKVVMTDEDNGWSTQNILTVWRDGKAIREERDGGSPEDQSFYRDWKWVKDALEEAYELGLKDGKDG
jgi:hypothetical protein